MGVRKTLVLLVSLFMAQFSFAQTLQSSLLIPQPVSVKWMGGDFPLDKNTVIVASDSNCISTAGIFNQYLKKYYGFELKIVSKAEHDAIRIVFDHDSTLHLPNEGYRLLLGEISATISGDEAGVFQGMQTILQLLPTQKSDVLHLPACQITDYPRYQWRGMHLDCSRHLFTKDEVKQYIDYLAFYKFNTFHWHLTDDQGWRIEIKQFPKLTSVGAWRNGTLIGYYSDHPQFDSVRYGGYYTQQDIKEIVAYAQKRFITIVPEIEMPGHCSAALASYPEFGCTGNQIEVAKNWGGFDDVFCPKEETFAFLDSVLSEVMKLFPSKYIHIGGDEVEKTQWKNSAFCQQLMKDKGLKDENELQSYFIQRIEQFVNSRGRSIIGWDEILEGGLAPNATVMSWRGAQGGMAAASQNHDAVMSPGDFCYFDHYQSTNPNEPLAIGGFLPIEKVYQFNPSENIPDGKKQFILGGQANVWTEYIPNFSQVQYMIFPRICAMSEALWSAPEKKNYTDFTDRLDHHFSLFSMWNARASTAIFGLKMDVMPEDVAGIRIMLSTQMKDATINFQLDDHHFKSPEGNAQANIILDRDGMVRAQVSSPLYNFVDSTSQQFFVNKVTGRKITLVTQPSPKYNTGGAFTLVNGIEGRIPWNGSEWLGFSGTDLNATIDLGSKENFSTVILGVLSDAGSWIWLPKQVEVLVSDDGINFSSVGKKDFEAIKNSGGRKVEFNVGNTSARYVKVIATNYGKIPAGNPGAGYDAWLFVDEISVE